MNNKILPTAKAKALIVCIAVAGSTPASADFFGNLQRKANQAAEDVQRQADQARRNAEQRTEQLRYEAQRRTDQFRHDAQRRTDQFRHETQRRTDQFRHEAQRHSGQLHHDYRRQVEQIQRETAHRSNQFRHGSQHAAQSLQRQIERNYEQARNNVEWQMRNRVDQALTHGHRVGAQADHLARRYQHDIERFITDPRNQERAVQAVITAGTMMTRLDGEPKRIVAEAVGTAGDNLMIETPSGRVVSLNDYARQTIREQAPFLQGSSIEENPAEALTYMLVFQDTNYMVNELRIVPDEHGRRVSMRDYAIARTGISAENALQAMAMADAFATFTDANASPNELLAAAKTLENNMSIGTNKH